MPLCDYELLDFGNGRKLERFGKYVLDRPAPQAGDAPSTPDVWEQADARFDEERAGQRGTWSGGLATDAEWTLRCGALSFQLRLTPYGQVGFFPEQSQIWDWITLAAGPTDMRPCKVLNLFAYTGGSTLAAAQAGAEVVHVDASRTAVAWARRNAERSELAAASIRWIVDDASAFVRRELRRGNRYDALILDPPSFGRGAHGEPWSLAKDFDALLKNCAELVRNQPKFYVVTCHTTGWQPRRLKDAVRYHLPLGNQQRLVQDWLQLRSRSNRLLDSGVYVCSS